MMSREAESMVIKKLKKKTFDCWGSKDYRD